jgi:hypothetical protein
MTATSELSVARTAGRRRFSIERLYRPVVLLAVSCFAGLFWSLALALVVQLVRGGVGLMTIAGCGIGIAVVLFAALAFLTSGGAALDCGMGSLVIQDEDKQARPSRRRG